MSKPIIAIQHLSISYSYIVHKPKPNTIKFNSNSNSLIQMQYDTKYNTITTHNPLQHTIQSNILLIIRYID
jgi:hypothetical protein